MARQAMAALAAATLGLTTLAVLDPPPVAAALPSQCTEANAQVVCTYTGAPGSSFGLDVPDGVAVVHVHAVGGWGAPGLGTGYVPGGLGGHPAAVDADLPVVTGDHLRVELRDNGGRTNRGPGVLPFGYGGPSSAVLRDSGGTSQLLVEAGGGGGGGDVIAPSGSSGSVPSSGGDAGSQGKAGLTAGPARPAQGGDAGDLDGAGGTGGVVDLGTTTPASFSAGSPGADGQGGDGGVGEANGGAGGGGTTGGGGGGAGGTGSTGHADGGGGGGGSSTVPAGGTLAVSLNESSVVRISFLLDARASVSPTSMDWGQVVVGATSAPRTVTLTNEGRSTVKVGTVSTYGSSQSAFPVVSDECSGTSLTPGATCHVGVAFRPTQHGDASATLQISDASNSSPHLVDLRGFGLAPFASVAPTTLDFGTQEHGVPAPPKTATLTNTGDADLHVTRVALKGDADFSVASDGCSGQALAPGASCEVAVGFTPADVDLRSATLTFTHDAAGGSTRASLTGTGVPPADLKILGVGSLYTGRDHLVSRVVAGTGTLQTYPLAVTNEDSVPRAFTIQVEDTGPWAETEIWTTGLAGKAVMPYGQWWFTTDPIAPHQTVTYSLRVTPFQAGRHRTKVTLQSEHRTTIESLTAETDTAAPANGTLPFELFAKQGTQQWVGGPEADEATTGPALKVGSSAPYTIRLKNNGTTATQIGLRLTDDDSCGAAYAVSVSAAGKVRTADAYAGTFLTPVLAPRAYQDVQVTIRRSAAGCGARLVRAESLDRGTVVRTSYLVANAAYEAATD